MLTPKSIWAFVVAIAALDTGCSATTGPSSYNKRVPTYATQTSYTGGGVIDDMSYEVNCTERVIFIDRDQRELFYRQDGTQRSKDEFCEKYVSTSATTRRSK